MGFSYFINILFFTLSVVINFSKSESSIDPRNCNIPFEKCKPIDFTKDPCPKKTLIDQKLLYSFGFGSKSGFLDSTYAIILNEAKTRTYLDLLEFDVKKYANDQASNTSSVVNTMLSNICGLTDKWPAPVDSFKILKDGNVWTCDTDVVDSVWDKIKKIFSPKCKVVREDLKK